MSGPTTAGLNALNAGEAWRYVGDTDQPAFGTYNDDANPGTPEVPAWANVGTPWPAMAFRLREPGIVDLIGLVEYVGSGNSVIFTLPDGYMPNEQAFISVVGEASSVKSPMLVVINDTGDVSAPDAVSGDYVYISGYFYLDTAAPPP